MLDGTGMKQKMDSERRYTVSKDPRNGMWYAHANGTPHIPIFGSFSDKEWESMEYAKMYDGIPNKVEEIEERRVEEIEREIYGTSSRRYSRQKAQAAMEKCAKSHKNLMENVRIG